MARERTATVRESPGLSASPFSQSQLPSTPLLPCIRRSTWTPTPCPATPFAQCHGAASRLRTSQCASRRHCGCKRMKACLPLRTSLCIEADHFVVGQPRAAPRACVACGGCQSCAARRAPCRASPRPQHSGQPVDHARFDLRKHAVGVDHLSRIQGYRDPVHSDLAVQQFEPVGDRVAAGLSRQLVDGALVGEGVLRQQALHRGRRQPHHR